MRQARLIMCAAATAILLTVPLASASVSDPALIITASNAAGTATLPIPLAAFNYDPFYSEYSSSSGQVNLYSPSSQYVARLKDLTAFMVDDPLMGVSIILQYTLIAGATDTNFTVDAGPVSFAPIPAALAAASMSDTIVLTDLNYNRDAWLSALNNHAYHTYYGQAGSPNEYFFHGSDSVGSFGGTIEGGVYNAYDNWPLIPGTYENLGIAVDRIRTATAFSLTYMDQAKIQSTFMLNIVPEPATAGFVALGVLLLLHRRR